MSLRLVGAGRAARRIRTNNAWHAGGPRSSLAREIHDLAAAGNRAGAASRLPVERPYPLPDNLKTLIGAA